MVVVLTWYLLHYCPIYMFYPIGRHTWNIKGSPWSIALRECIWFHSSCGAFQCKTDKQVHTTAWIPWCNILMLPFNMVKQGFILITFISCVCVCVWIIYACFMQYFVSWLKLFEINYLFFCWSLVHLFCLMLKMYIVYSIHISCGMI